MQPHSAQIMSTRLAASEAASVREPSPPRARRRVARTVLDLALAAGEGAHAAEAHADLGVFFEAKQAAAHRTVPAAPTARHRSIGGRADCGCVHELSVSPASGIWPGRGPLSLRRMERNDDRVVRVANFRYEIEDDVDGKRKVTKSSHGRVHADLGSSRRGLGGSPGGPCPEGASLPRSLRACLAA